MDGYVTREQFDEGMRELAADLRAEVLQRPVEVSVKMDANTTQTLLVFAMLPFLFFFVWYLTIGWRR